MTPETLLDADPVTAGWLIIIGLMLVITVAIPIIRTVVAGLLMAIAVATGRTHLRGTAARVMPRVGHLIGSLVIGTAAIAAPALASQQPNPGTLDAIDLDRDAGASRIAPQADTRSASTPQPTRAATASGDTGEASGPTTARPASSSTQQVLAQEAHQVSTPTAADSGMYTVRSGDTLWDIAAAELDEATNREISEAWKAIWRANHDVIGDNPGLILPGQQLDISAVTS